MKAHELRIDNIGTDITLELPRFNPELAASAPEYMRGPFRTLVGTITGLSTRSKLVEEQALCDIDVRHAYNIDSVLIRIDDRETIELHSGYDVQIHDGRFVVDEQDLRARNLHNKIVKAADGLNWLVINEATYCPLDMILNGEDREENTYGVECLGDQLYPLEIIK